MVRGLDLFPRTKSKKDLFASTITLDQVTRPVILAHTIETLH